MPWGASWGVIPSGEDCRSKPLAYTKGVWVREPCWIPRIEAHATMAAIFPRAAFLDTNQETPLTTHPIFPRPWRFMALTVTISAVVLSSLLMGASSNAAAQYNNYNPYSQPQYQQPQYQTPQRSYPPNSYQTPQYQPQYGYGQQRSPQYQQPQYQQPQRSYPPPQYQQPQYSQQPAYQTPSQPPAQQQPQYTQAEENTPEDTNLATYTQYIDDSIKQFQTGNVTKAIELMEKAIPLAADTSLPSAHNNLAVYYMKRGNTLTQKQQLEAALADYLTAAYWMDLGWPANLPKTDNQTTNTKIAWDNVATGYQNLRTPHGDKAAQLKFAKNFRLQGRFYPAIMAYKKVADLDPKNMEALKGLGDLLIVVNRPDIAKGYYKKVIAQLGDQTPDDLLVRLGNAQFKTGEANEAIQSLNQALAANPTNTAAMNMLETIWGKEIQVNPTSVPAHANLAAILQKKKEYDKALEHYRAAEQFANAASSKGQVDPNIIKQIRVNLGTLYQDMANYPMAGRAYDTVLELDPRYLPALYHRATLLKTLNKMPEAIQAFHKVLAVDPAYAPAHEELLALILAQSSPTQVGTDLDAYASRFPQQSNIQNRAAEYFHQQKNLPKAIQYYEAALRVNPNMAGVYANLGSAYHEQGNDPLALQNFEKAVSLEPDNETFQNLKASLSTAVQYKVFSDAVELQKAGKLQEAIPLYAQAVQQNPTNGDMRLAYAVALQADNQGDRALPEYQATLKLLPATDQETRAQVNYYIGTVYHQKEQLEPAKKAYQEALRLKPGYPEATEALGMIQTGEASTALTQAVEAYQNQQYTSALTLVQKALAVTPDDATAHYYKGLILTAQKREREAILSYKDTIRCNPEFRDAYYALGLALDNQKDALGAKTAFKKFIELSARENVPDSDDFVQYAKSRVTP